MNDPEILETIMLASNELNKSGIAYVHLCEADWDDAPQIPIELRKELRTTFSNTKIATGNKTPEERERLLQEDLVDLIGFGRKFLTNPDYPKRLKANAVLNEISDNQTLFGGDYDRGCTDYLFLS
jgi:N-ethylmaleimide reductase